MSLETGMFVLSLIAVFWTALLVFALIFPQDQDKYETLSPLCPILANVVVAQDFVLLLRERVGKTKLRDTSGFLV